MGIGILVPLERDQDLQDQRKNKGKGAAGYGDDRRFRTLKGRGNYRRLHPDQGTNARGKVGETKNEANHGARLTPVKKTRKSSRSRDIYIYMRSSIKRNADCMQLLYSCIRKRYEEEKEEKAGVDLK